MMDYTAFSRSMVGQSHAVRGQGCEDSSIHYCDPGNRFAIAALCDGISDEKCFRSAKGARFGCQSAVIILRNLMEAYLEEEDPAGVEKLLSRKQTVLDRVRRGILQSWSTMVEADLAEHPITEAEYQRLRQSRSGQQAEAVYRAGKRLHDVYGATFLAAAVCEQFHIALHIGDGILIRLEGDGRYTAPLPYDPRNDTPSPAALCHEDLLRREFAFRGELFPGAPQAVFVMCDGVADMPLSVDACLELLEIQKRMMERSGAEKPGLRELNREQAEYLDTFLDYHTHHDAADDCSICGIFHNTQVVAALSLTRDELSQEYQVLEENRKEEARVYQRRLSVIQKKLSEDNRQLSELEERRRLLERQIRETQAVLRANNG